VTPIQLAQEVENAYHGRDEDLHRRYLAQLVAVATGPALELLDVQKLATLRNDLVARMELVDGRIRQLAEQRRNTLRASFEAEQSIAATPGHPFHDPARKAAWNAAGQSLDPSAS
jgi:hypothetical protein